jgi:hypothetical protein
MILEVLPAHRRHHGVGIRVPASLSKTVEDSGHASTAATNGEAVADEQNPMLGMNWRRAEQPDHSKHQTDLNA